MNPKVAAHRLRAIADAIEQGDIARILADPYFELSPQFRAHLEQLLVATNPRGLAGEIEAGA